MKKIMFSIVALLLAGLFFSTPASAQARGYHGYNGGYRGYNGGYAARGPVYYGNPGYGYRGGYVRPGYGIFPRAGFVVGLGYAGYYADPAANWVWDPYLGQYVWVSYYPNYGYWGFYSSHFGLVIRVR